MPIPSISQLFCRPEDSWVENHPFNPIASSPITPNNFWDRLATPQFAKLLDKCNYMPELQSFHLRIFQEVVSRLPHPSLKHKTKLNGDGTLYDISWNYDSRTSSSTARFLFDQFGSPRALIKELEAKCFLQPDEANLSLLDAATILMLDASWGEHPPYFFSAIDCQQSGKCLYKVYLRPTINHARELSHRRGAEVFHHLDETFFGSTLNEAYKIIDKFNQCFSLEKQQTIHMLAWDCVQPSLKSRIKIYLYYSFTSLQAIRDMWTQRGQLSGPEIEIGLQCIDELWNILYMDGKSQGADDELLNREGRRQTICINLELMPGIAMPVPKLYIQPSMFGNKTDAEIALALQGWFKLKGLGQLGESYLTSVLDILEHRDLSKDTGSQSYMTLSVKKGGQLAVTMYFRPRIFKTAKIAAKENGTGGMKRRISTYLSGLK